jgi:hypothetical protein
MFVAFMPLHILLCDEMLLYFVNRSRSMFELIFNSIEFVNSKENWKIIKGFLFLFKA